MVGKSGSRVLYIKAQRSHLVYRVWKKHFCLWWCFSMENDVFNQRDMTILIVDDEARIRDFVRMNLELEHYRVIEAHDGVQALEQLRENLPDLIVLDVMMPEMDGFET